MWICGSCLRLEYTGWTPVPMVDWSEIRVLRHRESISSFCQGVFWLEVISGECLSPYTFTVGWRLDTQIIGYMQDEGYREAGCLGNGLLLYPFLWHCREAGYPGWCLVRWHVVATCVNPYNLHFHFQRWMVLVALNKQGEFIPFCWRLGIPAVLVWQHVGDFNADWKSPAS